MKTLISIITLLVIGAGLYLWLTSERNEIPSEPEDYKSQYRDTTETPKVEYKYVPANERGK